MQELDRKYFYESFADEFDSKMNMYDTLKRVDVIFNELLTESIVGKDLLDAGCGTGWFSKKAVELGANVTSMDLGPKLLAQVKKKCDSSTIVGSVMDIPFDDNTFDIVVSSEVIEHTEDPFAAIKEMFRVLKPGGILALTTPNRFWYFSLIIANTFGLRPYQGWENWISRKEMRRYLNNSGFSNYQITGIHAFPFVINKLNPLLDYLHRFKKHLAPFMVNIAVKAYK